MYLGGRGPELCCADRCRPLGCANVRRAFAFKERPRAMARTNRKHRPVSSPSFDDLQHINAGWSSAISKKRNAKITMFSNNNIVIAKLLATIASADPP